MPSQHKSESELQQAFVKLLRNALTLHYPDLRWMHAIPNGARFSSIGTAAKIKREGLTAGVADMFLPLAKGGLHGLYLEFKFLKGRLSPRQKEFQFWCLSHGYGYVVVRSVEDAATAVTEYLMEA